jgi:hypothetical protein
MSHLGAEEKSRMVESLLSDMPASAGESESHSEFIQKVSMHPELCMVFAKPLSDALCALFVCTQEENDDSSSSNSSNDPLNESQRIFCWRLRVEFAIHEICLYLLRPYGHQQAIS